MACFISSKTWHRCKISIVSVWAFRRRPFKRKFCLSEHGRWMIRTLSHLLVVKNELQKVIQYRKTYKWKNLGTQHSKFSKDLKVILLCHFIINCEGKTLQVKMVLAWILFKWIIFPDFRHLHFSHSDKNIKLSHNMIISLFISAHSHHVIWHLANFSKFNEVVVLNLYSQNQGFFPPSQKFVSRILI